MSAQLNLPVAEIAALCEAYGVEELSLFGSALRADFQPDSDVDFLVVFHDNDYGPWMGKLQDLEQDLSRLLGRTVELVSKRGVEQSENWVRRRAILDSARVVYENRGT